MLHQLKYCWSSKWILTNTLWVLRFTLNLPLCSGSLFLLMPHFPSNITWSVIDWSFIDCVCWILLYFVLLRLRGLFNIRSQTVTTLTNFKMCNLDEWTQKRLTHEPLKLPFWIKHQYCYGVVLLSVGLFVPPTILLTLEV